MESVTEPPAGATPEPEAAAPSAPAGTPCRSCAAPLADGQEWCLACGAARHPARLHAGRRPFLVTVGATIALLGVAAAASYAAVIDQAPVVATATVPAPPPPVVATTPTTVAPAPTTPTTPPPSVPATTPTYTPPYTPPASSYVPPATPYVPPSSGGGSTTTTKTTPTTTTPTVPPITVIPAKDTTPAAYDPYNQLLAPLSDPADAIGSAAQQWSALTDPGADPASPKSMQAGLMISVDAKTALQELTFLTDTPGFTVQVYGSADKTPPPEITHGWTNLGQRSSVDAKQAKNDPKGDGRVRISLGSGDTFRHILLWFTTPPPVKAPTTPPAPSQVNISKLRLYK